MPASSAPLGAPVPQPTQLTEPFWQACHEGRLDLQRCGTCARMRFYPAATCPYCASAGGTWETLSGRGTIYSWIVTYKSPDPYWMQHVPFVTAIVELDEQEDLYLPGLLTDVDPDDVAAGMPVELWFDEVAPGRSIPRWRPAGFPSAR
jgi:hypothetical protein